MYRVFRTLRVYREDYFNIYLNISNFIDTVANYYDLPISKIRYSHFLSYCIDVLQYDIGYSYKKGSIAGLTLISDDLVAIVVNAHNTVPNERVYFSLMHEIVHTILHIDENKPMQKFASVRNSCNAYETHEELRKEIEADICASFLMINEDALYEALKEQKTFGELRELFYTSNTAMQTRLSNFLIYNVGLSYQQACNTLNNYVQHDVTLEYLFPECSLEMY